MQIKPRSGSAQARKQDATPVGIDFAGNVAGGLPYLPLARKYLRELRKQANGGVRFKAYDLGDVRFEVSVSTNTNMLRIITSTGVYLDSGWYNHLTLGYLNELAFHPSQVLYGAEQASGAVQGSLTLKDGKAQGQTLPAGRNSKPMGAAKALVKTSPNGFSSSTAIYADDPTLLKRKKIQALIKPSNFVGLTQLYVQCLYGSTLGQKQYDIQSMDETGQFAAPLFDFPVLQLKAGTDAQGNEQWVDLKFFGSDAPWVVANGWKYWLVTVKGATVTFRRIKTTLTLPKQAPTYTGLEARQAHAAMLAGARLSSTATTFACTPINGQPLAYGWKTSDTGQAAQIVCHSSEYKAEYDVGGNPDKNANIRKAYHYAATVQFGQDGNPSGLAVTLLEEAYWQSSVELHCLWLPDGATTMELALAPLGNPYYWQTIECDAPLYLYADYAGGPTKLVRIYCNGTAPGDEGGYSGDITVTGQLMTAEDPHYGVGTFIMTRSAPEADGLSWGGLELLAAAGYIEADNRTHQTGPFDPVYFSRIDGASGAMHMLKRFPDIFYDWEQFNKAMLLIPLDDANAVVYGTMAYVTFSGKYESGTGTEKGDDYPVTAPRTVYFSYFDHADSTWKDNGTMTLKQDYDHSNPSAVSVWSAGLTSGKETSEFTLDLLTTAPVSLDSWTGGQDADYNPVNVSYFFPQIGVTGNPYIQQANVYTALGGAYYYNLSFGETGSSGWPMGAYNIIGWA